MIREIDYKVPNGKLLRIKVELNKNTICSIKICGDFFIYPESAIMRIEKFLVGKEIDSFVEDLKDFIKKNKIIIIGFNENDLADALMRL